MKKPGFENLSWKAKLITLQLLDLSVSTRAVVGQ